MKENILLKSVCTFAIGGPARYFVLAKTENDLFDALDFAKSKGLKPFVFGGGSNLLFPDEGLDTVVIKVAMNQISLNSDATELYCQAGASWGQIARYCTQHNLYGLEALYGLPGTVGGAVYGNAGCHGLETKDVLLNANIYSQSKSAKSTYLNSDFKFEYRTSSIKHNPDILVLDATFKISTDPQEASGDPNQHSTERKLKQPTGLTTGSFFKNPPNNYAGALIEQAGLKGFQHNGIKISDIHANFFINTGTATAKDVLELMKIVQDTVKQKFNLEIEPEVQIIESQDWHV